MATKKVYTASEFDSVAGVLAAGNGCGLNEEWVARALKQAAAQARVLERFAEALQDGNTQAHSIPSLYSARALRALNRLLAEEGLSA